MAQSVPPQVDVVTPAEARFWQEWADKAPGLMREMAVTLDKVKADFRPYQIGGITIGAVLGAATCTKHIPGKWKWVTGTAAVAGLGVGVLAGQLCSVTDANQQYLNYADGLEKDPKLRQQLANFLSGSVTGETIQKVGIDNAVLEQVMEFGTRTPYLQAPGQQHGTIGR